LFGTFGCIGLVLAAVGLYGVMSYAVTRRTREIGIRMALGAQPGTVERLVLRQGMILTLIAVALGWPAAWMLAKMASSFLYGIQPPRRVDLRARSTVSRRDCPCSVLYSRPPRRFHRSHASPAHRIGESPCIKLEP
ncbi:MAG TPA: FtsX-like permease family protein, partial [Terracidiphilus sp.]|nr:FtsX-like permease family protein [Terracidiphilus sp.]